MDDDFEVFSRHRNRQPARQNNQNSKGGGGGGRLNNNGGGFNNNQGGNNGNSNNGNSNQGKNCNDRSNEDSGDDFPSMATDLMKSINWKLGFLIFIFGIFIFSDLFIENFVSQFSGAVEGDCPTTKGTVIQLLFLVLGYLIADLFNQCDFI